MKMKYYFIAVIIIYTFNYCNNSEIKKSEFLLGNSRSTQVKLVDSLGVIDLYLPIVFDTSFYWIHYSDCGKSCDEQKYRFQSKQNPIVEETGSYVLRLLKDSVYQFTIKHSGYIDLRKGDTAGIDYLHHKHLRDQLKYNPINPNMILDTMQKINGRYYSLFIMEKNDSIYSKKVLAATTIKGNLIQFEYELISKRKDSIVTNFIKNSIELIKTIRISKE